MTSTIKRAVVIAALGLGFAAPAIAGDAAAGEKTFKKCKSCHEIKAPDGTQIYKGGKTGPNLYGIIGAQAGGHKQSSKGLTAVGEGGLVWTEELLAEYVADPSKFIKTHGGEGRSKMSFKLKKGGDDVAAYLASVAQ
jgi:cytochrome c